jgi:NADH:ubiquinone oxidoreductase subunit C
VTIGINCEETGKKLQEVFPGSVVSTGKADIVVEANRLLEIAGYLKNTAGLEFDYLTFVTAVDFLEYMETVYRLVSLKNNLSLVLKTRCYNREDPVVPSVVSVWRAAYYQEREIFDLFGIKFDGHPDMRRLLLWEGFVGHPLRRDYL